MVKPIIYIAVLLAVFWGTTASTYRPLLNGQITDAGDLPTNDFPHQADIRHNGRHVCSGAVIGKYDVLTAAHCIQRLNHEDLSVIVGSTVFNRTQGIHEVIMVQIHPLFNADTLDYDAALIKVKKPFKFGRYVDSVLIPQPGDELRPGETALVSGRETQTNDEDRQLKAADVTIITHEECNRRFASHHGVGEHMLCSGPAPDAAEPISCLADPGAPLVAHGKLYGIASWGDACAPGAPNNVVYTDVSKLQYFLTKNTFIYENAASKLCAALQLVISLLPMIPVVPAWVVTALNLLLTILGC